MERPIELYEAPTGDCIRAAIAIEETMLPYTVHHVDLRGGEQRREPFLALNPVGKVPVIVERHSGSAPLVPA
jgi:GSH-dependent disulfide-bond oxidoreductase